MFLQLLLLSVFFVTNILHHPCFPQLPCLWCKWLPTLIIWLCFNGLHRLFHWLFQRNGGQQQCLGKTTSKSFQPRTCYVIHSPLQILMIVWTKIKAPRRLEMTTTLLKGWANNFAWWFSHATSPLISFFVSQTCPHLRGLHVLTPLCWSASCTLLHQLLDLYPIIALPFAKLGNIPL